MGCGASKDKTINDKNVVREAKDRAGKEMTDRPFNTQNNQQPLKEYQGDWQEMIKNENLKEASLQNIDNGLWRDTKNEVAIYNAQEAVDV